MKVRNNTNRLERYETKKETMKKRQLREPLELNEKVLVLAERLRKKEAPKNIYKLTTENVSFFNREKKFIVKKRLKGIENPVIYYYWIAPEDDVEKTKN